MFVRRDVSKDLAAMSGRLRRLGVSRHPGLLIRPRQEGYRDYAFGGRVGPSVSAEHLFHELAHAVEFGPESFNERVYQGGFRFHVPEKWIYDRFCTDAQTMQATDRELRTFAYQFHLLRLAGRKLLEERYALDQARAMRFMHDWYRVPGEGDHARIAYCQAEICRYIEVISAADALTRLEGWLDETHKYLQELHRTRSERPVSRVERYLGEGLVYSA